MFQFEINNHYAKKIDDGLTLNIKCINLSTANLYFTNDENLIVQIPTDITVYLVYMFNLQNVNKIIQCGIGNKYFSLDFSNKYMIEYKGNVIFRLDTQRGWKINDYDLGI